MNVEEQIKSDVAGRWESMLQGLPASSTDFLAGHSTSIEAGRALFPYLVDHGFQDMIVVPGSFYIEQALRIHIESLHAAAGRVKRIQFLKPVILLERNVTLSIEAKWLDNETVHYVFSEAGTGQPCATLEIECGGNAPAKTTASDFSVEAFQQRADYRGDQGDYYCRLRENGN